MNSKAIIFDLGGVILDLDYILTEKAFIALGIENFHEMYSQAAHTQLFDQYEKGLCSTNYFVNQLLKFMPPATSPNKVVSSWNAMILEYPIEKLNFLLELKEKGIRTFLLSNTNDLHIQVVERRLKNHFPNNELKDFFEKVYYSSDVKDRKPNISIFQMVCEVNHLLPENTLFIDDTLQHVEGAKKIGLKTHYFQKEDDLKEIVNQFLNN